MSEIDRRILGQLSQMSRPDCPTVKMLGDFLDQTLDVQSNTSVELHLRSCPACINRLIELRELARLKTQGPEPSPALLQDVISLVRADASSTPEQERTSPGLLASIFGAIRSIALDFRFVLAGAVAALVAVLLLRSPQISTRQSGSENEPAQESAGVFAEGILSKRIVPAVAPVSVGSEAFNKHVLAALEALPKTLLLEQTRGVVNTTVYREASPATVLVITDTALGSGVVLDNSGEILTNYHVIRDAKRVAVVFKPQQGVEVRKDLAYGAMPMKVDEIADLAILRVAAPARLLHPLRVADISKLEVGDDVHAIGHPEGEVWTYTTGTISQIRPHYEWKEGEATHRATVIQTQTAINPGNSGGPLLNNQAEVIGINSFRIEGEGLNYAIAADTVEAFLKRPTSRPAEMPAKTSRDISRIERFGDNIVGAYMKSKKPPPDVWLVFASSSETPEYAVTGASMKTKLDTFFKGADPKWQEIIYYLDVNCDGIVDLIAYKRAGSDKPERYQRPETPTRLDSLAGELAQAFDARLIPYRQVQLCR
jgi:S1-C subfamily serine protease